MKRPYLSIVVASRNDDHGGDLLNRMQIFVTALVYQLEKKQISSELIVVEWNPPAGRAPLADALTWPDGGEWCTVRLITVPHSLQEKRYGDRLEFYQMIAKNVGILRARGEFVLATNIDILFSSLLMEELSRKTLNKDTVYRCDRLDVENSIPLAASVEEQLSQCQKKVIRVNNRYGTWRVGFSSGVKKTEISRIGNKCGEIFHRAKASLLDAIKPRLRPMEYKGALDEIAWYFRAIPSLHTNACGDFTLMDRESWKELCGYPELAMYSFHIDSLLLHLAMRAGKKMVEFPPEMVIYHIEHGGGWTPESETELFERQRRKGIYTLKHGTYVKLAQRISRGNFSGLVSENWGLPNYSFQETHKSLAKPV